MSEDEAALIIAKDNLLSALMIVDKDISLITLINLAATNIRLDRDELERLNSPRKYVK